MAALAAMSFCVFAHAAGSPIPPGEYAYVDGGNNHGTLVIKGNTFSIETVGGNCHSCTAGGKMQGATGVVAESKCRIAMSLKNDVLQLKGSPEDACREQCGMRATFEGEYRKPPAACTDAKRTARVNLAHRQYAAKNYDAARTTLKSVLSECTGFMDWIERDKARSDLALTEFRRGDKAQCVATLADTVAAHADKDDATFGLPPCDKDNYEPTGKAIRFNLNLCQAPAADASSTRR